MTTEIPINDSRLESLLVDGKVPWVHKRTAAAKLFGIEQSKSIYYLFLSGKYAGIKLGSWTLLVTLCYCVVTLGLFRLIPDVVMVVFAGVILIPLIAFFMFLIDLKIAWLVFQHWALWINLILGLICCLCLIAIWDDTRLCITPIFFLMVIIISLLDAVPPGIRSYFGLSALLVLLFSVSAILILLNLSRFPGVDTNISIDLGTFNGLSERSILIYPNQLLTDCVVGLFFFLGRMLLHLKSQKSSQEMLIIRGKIYAGFDEEFDLLRDWICFKKVSRTQRLHSQIDPEYRV